MHIVMSDYVNRCTIFHGSEFVIEHPQYGFGKVHNDYGQGFYCTFERDMAMEWAVGEDHDGYANRYEIDLVDLNILDLSKPPFNTLHWLSVLVSNRIFDMDGDLMQAAFGYLRENFPVDMSEVDVMVGYRADDNYFSFARGFLSGMLSYQQLQRAIRLGGLGMQFVLKSERAFERIKFTGNEKAFRVEHLRTRQEREHRARREYADLRGGGLDPASLYMLDVIRQGMRGNDARLS